MTAQNIKMNFEQSKKCSQELLEISDNIQAILSEVVDEVVDTINNDWTGDNATKYLKKLQALRTEIQETSQCVHEASEAVGKIAQNVYNAEMTALEIAQTRTAR